MLWNELKMMKTLCWNGWRLMKVQTIELALMSLLWQNLMISNTSRNRSKTTVLVYFRPTSGLLPVVSLPGPSGFWMHCKKTLAKTGADINDTNNLDEMIAAQFTNQKKERLVLIPLSPPSGNDDDSTSNTDRKAPPGKFGHPQETCKGYNCPRLPSGPASARVPSGQGPTGTRTTWVTAWISMSLKRHVTCVWLNYSKMTHWYDSIIEPWNMGHIWNKIFRRWNIILAVKPMQITLKCFTRVPPTG